MTHSQLLLGLTVAVGGPLLTLWYLRRILLQVLDMLCPAPGSSEFWWRSIVVLALAGSVLLMLFFGPADETMTLIDSLRRVLMLTCLSIFISVAIIARRIWNQVALWLRDSSSGKPALPAMQGAAQS